MVTTTAILEFAASPIEAVQARQPVRNLAGNPYPVLSSPDVVAHIFGMVN